MFSLLVKRKKERKSWMMPKCTCPDLSVCLGDRLPVLLREFMLPWEGVERNESFGGGGLAGSPGTEVVTEPRLFFLLDGGMRAEGRSAGTGSFSRAL